MTAIALALGGGAALGWAHIGVLRALEEGGIEVGAVAGTSIGALAAVCLAADRLGALEEIARSANLRTMLRYLDPHMRRGAMLGGRMIARELQLHLGHLAFDDLAIPAAAVAADLATGEEVILDTGPVADAIRASMALPGIFHPIIRDGRVLIDGGAVMPVPVSVARSLGGDMPVVAVNLQGDYANRASATGLRSGHRFTTMGVVRSAAGLLFSRLARQSLELTPPELEIAPRVGHIEVHHFMRAHELIEIGRSATEDALPAIRALGPALNLSSDEPVPKH